MHQSVDVGPGPPGGFGGWKLCGALNGGGRQALDGP